MTNTKPIISSLKNIISTYDYMSQLNENWYEYVDIKLIQNTFDTEIQLTKRLN